MRFGASGEGKGDRSRGERAGERGQTYTRTHPGRMGRNFG
jgi:hypothetical protein